MKTFNQITEAPKSKGVVFTFGRFNPPTAGHVKLATKMKSIAGGDDILIFTSHTRDKKKNPLTNAQIRHFMNPMLPRGVQVAQSDARTVFDALNSIYKLGYRSIKMVVGSDRINEFQSLITKYNGIKARHGYYNFESVKVVSAGERDPDATGIEGMSASKMRALAYSNDEEAFINALPSGYKLGKRLFGAVRRGMGVTEDFPDFMYEIYNPSKHEWGTDKGREYAQTSTPGQPIINWKKMRYWREAEDLSPKILKYKEKAYRDLKKSRDDFVKRYGDRADDVMHGTAMQMAKKKYGYS